MRRSGRIFLTMGLVLGVAAAVSAHAFLERADPRVGSTVRTPPAEVRLWFTERLEPAFSSVQVVDTTDHQVDKGDVQVDSSAPKQLRVGLLLLPPGTYTVRWRVLSVDSHVTEGKFTFRVAP
jgi:methionine-rich copper-binding protein CopC